MYVCCMLLTICLGAIAVRCSCPCKKGWLFHLRSCFVRIGPIKTYLIFSTFIILRRRAMHNRSRRKSHRSRRSATGNDYTARATAYIRSIFCICACACVCTYNNSSRCIIHIRVARLMMVTRVSMPILYTSWLWIHVTITITASILYSRPVVVSGQAVAGRRAYRALSEINQIL